MKTKTEGIEMKAGEILYVLVLERYTDCSSDGYIPFTITRVDGDSVYAKSKLDKEIEFIKRADGVYQFKKGIQTFIGVADILKYYDEANIWTMRDDEYCEGMEDHIEEAQELRVQFKDKTSEHYEILHEGQVDEILQGLGDVIYAALRTDLRLWKDSRCSIWEKGILKEFTEKEVKEIKERN